MFQHVFAYRLKYLMRNKEMLFWTFLFPIVLSIFFTMAFSNLYKVDTFAKIPVAVVDSITYQSDLTLKSALQAVSGTGNDALFELTVTTREEAQRKLIAGDIAGYMDTEGGLNLKVAGSGIQETIIKSFLDSYLQMSKTAQTVLTHNPGALLSGFMHDLTQNASYTHPLSGMPKPDTLLVYYYALLAMTCLYASFWGCQEITDVQANLSPQGARVSVAPVHKLKAFLAGICASMLVQFAEMVLLLLFMHFALGVDFGNQWGYVLLLCLVGSLMGITFGAIVGASVHKSEGARTGVLIGVSMFLSFFSGLMFAEIKYIVAKAFPLSSYLNPATLVADGFYALYYYQDHSRFFLNLGILLLYSALFCLIIYKVLRRQKYASL